MKKAEGLKKIQDSLYSVGLDNMADSIVNTLKGTDSKAEIFDSLVTAVDTYVTEEHERRAAMLLKRSSLPAPAYFADLWDYSVRKLDREFLEDLLDLEFLKDRRNLMIQGPAGTGKTWFAAVLATKACREGIRTKWITFPRLLRDLLNKKEKGGTAYESRLKYYSRFKMLCIDEFLNVGKEELIENAYTIQEFFDTLRNSKVSVVMTAQFASDRMEMLFNPVGLGDSIKGRVMGGATVLMMSGPNLNLYSPENEDFK